MPLLRPHLYIPVVDIHGNVLSDITVRFYEPGSTQQITQVVYAAPTGNAEYSQPISFPNGVIDVYLAQPRRVRVGVRPAGQAEFFLEDRDFFGAGGNSVLASDAPLIILGSPQAVGQVIVANSDGTARWGTTAGGSFTNPLPRTGLFVTDVAGVVWDLTVDVTGKLVVTRATPTPGAVSFYASSYAGAY